MSVQYGKLCSVILLQHFGETVQTVGDCLFAAVQSRTLSTLVKSTGLSRAQCVHSLAILLKFHLATCQTARSGLFTEYMLQRENVLLVLRYPRYVHLVQTRPKSGEAAAALVEELLRAGSQPATRLLARCCDDKSKYAEFEAAFLELVQSNYVYRAPQLVDMSTDVQLGVSAAATTTAPLVPKFVVDQNLLYVAPKLSAVEWDKLRRDETYQSTDKDIFWLVNMDRFHQDFRDVLMQSAVERKYDANAGECMKYILQQMYVCTQPWMTYSNPISLVDIRHMVEGRSPNAELIKFLDQYVNILHDDQMRILSKFGDMGGGQYVVEMKNTVDQLTWVCIENIITEKFGTKAARIFRVVRQKNYVEQEEIQRQAMIPAKEAKLYTYKLLEEHYLQAKPIRKPGGGGTGMAKCFFMFHVNQQQIVQMLLETCYKALFNSMIRSAYDKSENRRLIEKSQRLESIVEAMKERGETDEYIAEIYETLTPPERDVLLKVKVRIKSLYSAEIGLDETIFLLQLFMKYRQISVTK